MKKKNLIFLGTLLCSSPVIAAEDCTSIGTDLEDCNVSGKLTSVVMSDKPSVSEPRGAAGLPDGSNSTCFGQMVGIDVQSVAGMALLSTAMHAQANDFDVYLEYEKDTSGAIDGCELQIIEVSTPSS